MNATAKKNHFDLVSHEPSPFVELRLATVLEGRKDKLVRISHPELTSCWAHIASDVPTILSNGTRVLVVVDQQEYFIVSVLKSSVATNSLRCLTGLSGARATLAEDETNQEVLRVCDQQGSLLFEYFPQKQQSIVHSSTGDLSFSSAGSMTFIAKQGVQIRSPEGVHLAAVNSEGQEQSSFSIKRCQTQLKAAFFAFQATKASFAISQVTSLIHRAVVHADHVKYVYRMLEVSAQRIVEKANETYREVEELAQTRAGRLRLVAEKTFHLLAEHSHLKAKKSLKIKGEKIYLS